MTNRYALTVLFCTGTYTVVINVCLKLSFFQLWIVISLKSYLIPCSSVVFYNRRKYLSLDLNRVDSSLLMVHSFHSRSPRSPTTMPISPSFPTLSLYRFYLFFNFYVSFRSYVNRPIRYNIYTQINTLIVL